LLESSLNNQLLKSRRDNSRFAIIYLDLDKFKTVNDTYGHEIGDRLLIEVARRLTSLVANNDCAARLGGDEFILMKSDLTTQKIENFITQIGRLLAEEYVLDNITLKISASIGYSVYPHDGEEIQELLSKADKDLYATKQTKRLSE
jgi:diguanylate cyclase (GGDEF)-like protein